MFCPSGPGVCRLHQYRKVQQLGREGSFLSALILAVFIYIFHVSLLPCTAPGLFSICALALPELLCEVFLLMPCQTKSGDHLYGRTGKKLRNISNHLLFCLLSAENSFGKWFCGGPQRPVIVVEFGEEHLLKR